MTLHRLGGRAERIAFTPRGDYLVGDRLREATAKLPPGIEPELGPIATGLGEIFLFLLAAEPGATDADGRPWDTMALRTLQDWVVKPQLRTGAATENGEEVVLGTVFMLMGENSRTVARRVNAKLVSVNRTLPDGVVAKAVYDRTKLVDRTIATVRSNLVEGALLVVAVLFLLLGNFRAAFLTALVIPLSMLLTFAGMARGRISGNLMSLGALDFGLIVDEGDIAVHALRIPGTSLTQAVEMQGALERALGRFPEVSHTFTKIAAALEEVPGAADVSVEQSTGLPFLEVDFDRPALARFGLSLDAGQQVVRIAIGGEAAGQLFEGDRRFDLVVRLPEALRADLDALARLPIALPEAEASREDSLRLASGGQAARRVVPLGAVAALRIGTGPNQVSRENGKRRVVVTANVRGRDIGSFVADAQTRLEQRVQLPTGYWSTWGGQFEQLESATRRLQVVVPLALLLILAILAGVFGSLRHALLVFSGVPLAWTGGILSSTVLTLIVLPVLYRLVEARRSAAAG